jgi:hypothetical protein
MVLAFWLANGTTSGRVLVCLKSDRGRVWWWGGRGGPVPAKVPASTSKSEKGPKQVTSGEVFRVDIDGKLLFLPDSRDQRQTEDHKEAHESAQRP